MTEPTTIETIAEASEAVAKAPKFITATLADGTEVVVRKLSWMHFNEIWGELSKTIFAFAQMQGDGELSEDEVVKAMMGVPMLAEKLIAATTNYTVEDVQKFDNYMDVVTIMIEAIAHNNPSEALVFFSGMLPAAQGSARVKG